MQMRSDRAFLQSNDSRFPIIRGFPGQSGAPTMNLDIAAISACSTSSRFSGGSIGNYLLLTSGTMPVIQAVWPSKESFFELSEVSGRPKNPSAQKISGIVPRGSETSAPARRLRRTPAVLPIVPALSSLSAACHTKVMARGWESKSVESQIESAESRKKARQTPIDPVQAAKQHQRESLLLSRTRILHDIEQAQNPRYKQTLNAALKHLDDKLAELERPAEGARAPSTKGK